MKKEKGKIIGSVNEHTEMRVATKPALTRGCCNPPL